MEDLKDKHIYGSECCEAEIVPVPETVVKTSPGVTSYYRGKCAKCEKLTHDKTLKIYDSAGVEIKHGDIVECPDMPIKHACRYHAAYKTDYGFDIRDLGHNNCGMYQIYAPYFTIGHYSKHLDKLSDEDLRYYWNTTREEAGKTMTDEKITGVCVDIPTIIKEAKQYKQLRESLWNVSVSERPIVIDIAMKDGVITKAEVTDPPTSNDTE